MISKGRIKPGATVKVKTWNELKKLHGSILTENHSYSSLCKFLKLYAGKKITVLSTEKSKEHELKIYIVENRKEFNGMYLLLKEIASVCTEIELDESLFEL